ncbi:xanthine dehydrogenase small subunit [Ahrensia kielensis]|uniref:Xanthine dehydrogenase small subunit n=1 Tax=Ahrensia kielensis TaxID=76980 RepID=A0ABU9T849_9HYPH
MAQAISFTLNGKPVRVSVRPDTTVLDLLRGPLNTTGTKEGCAEGDCGACTVLLKRKGINGGIANAANACIMTAAQIDGAEITTVEGLAHEGVLNLLQEAMAENGASQCGFCTPGIAVALTGLLAKNSAPSEEQIHDALAGNLCRCTGYRPIVEAAQKAAGKIHLLTAAEMQNTVSNEEISFDGSIAKRPTSLAELLEARRELPNATLLAGGTDLGVARAAYEKDWSSIIVTNNVKELRSTKEDAAGWTFGAAVTWQEILENVGQALPSFGTLIRRFGSTQIRSMGTMGGNIGTASPIGDGPPALIALGAQITFAAVDGTQTTMPLEDFFLDYRKTELPQNGVIVSIHIPKPKSDEHFRVYKVSKRYDQDISTVCGAFWVKMSGDTVEDVRLAFGGMAAIPKRAKHAEDALRGKAMTADNVEKAGKLLGEDLTPLSDWRGSANYREKVASGLIKRFMHDLNGEAVEVMAL